MSIDFLRLFLYPRLIPITSFFWSKRWPHFSLRIQLQITQISLISTFTSTLLPLILLLGTVQTVHKMFHLHSVEFLVDDIILFKHYL